jgi:hypothetical protein
MSDIIRLWVETSHHTAFRCGGWAFVRADRGGIAGKAGGERNVSAASTARDALLQALSGLPAGASIQLTTASPLILRAPALAAAAADQGPPEDAAVWASLQPALAAYAITFEAAPAAPRTPPAFTAAWAEQGRDKAKARGAFAAVIPRSNLANAGVRP